ncbi:MAG TPA: DnaJ domain-containing protein [Acidimicrobiales bacterium]|jgi:curved DNA-binding protein CbpA|nr:DnaJ domain-containing protein [Acidimicrobiales bacterium]
MNHYEVLGVTPDAPTAEVRRAYLRTVLGEADDDRARRSDAAEAWAVLRDPAKRAAYDQQLAAERSPAPPATASDPVPTAEARADPAPAGESPPAPEPEPTPEGTRRVHPPLPDEVPHVAAQREPPRLARDRPGQPSGPDLRPARLKRVMDVFPAAIIAIGVLLALAAWLVGSGGLLLFGLLLLAVGVVSFILIPLFENINDR